MTLILEEPGAEAPGFAFQDERAQSLDSSLNNNNVALSPLEMFGEWIVACVGSNDTFRRRWGSRPGGLRQEQRLADELARVGIATYLPFFERRTRDKNLDGSPVYRRELLWPGYLCVCCGGASDRHRVETHEMVHAVLRVSRQREFAMALDFVHRMIADNRVLEKFSGPVDGCKCQVSGGPFQGLSGIVNRIGRKFVVAVEGVGAAYTLEIDADLLEPVAE